jgi:hypothetical protein
VTDLHLAKAVVEALRWTRDTDHAPLGMDEYVGTRGSNLRTP